MFKKHEDEKLEEYKKRLVEQGIAQEAYVALGITPDYAWYESEQIRRQIDSVNTRFQHLVRVMEERQKDQNKLIEQLMEANKNLSKKIKEMEK
jgi:phosphopantetheine adenylyltransferase